MAAGEPGKAYRSSFGSSDANHLIKHCSLRFESSFVFCWIAGKVLGLCFFCKPVARGNCFQGGSIVEVWPNEPVADETSGFHFAGVLVELYASLVF